MPLFLSYLAAPSSRSPRRRPVLARVRRLLVIDFTALDRLNLGDMSDLDAEIDGLFSRGGHRGPTRRVA